tara:strand:+ start:32429 stop:33256 length:828 start_codon:yes stop_codon:yes gene_type:complete
MEEFEARLAKIREQIDPDHFFRVPLLDDPQFTNADAEACSYVSATQLHNWVSRGWVRLTHANPGKGKRRLYTGKDIIAVAVAAALQPFGMVQVAEQLNRVHIISGRVHRLMHEQSCPYGYAMAIVMEPDGSDWLYIPLSPETPETEIPVPACVVLDVDRLIVETVENLLRVIDGQEIPPRLMPKKQTPEEAEDEFLDFLGRAYRDDQGNRIYRGLTLEESIEFQALSDNKKDYRLNDGPRPEEDENDRYLELSDRVDRAARDYNAQRRRSEAENL